MQSLKGKKAIITGGSRGIGAATALELAKEGVDLGIVGRSEEHLNNVKEKLSQYDVDVFTAKGDVSYESDITQAIKELTDQLGHVDILINNAGVGAYGEFLELTTEDWNKVLQTNVMGIVHTTKAVLPGMIDRKTGDIINISSMSGLKGTKGSSAYSASKFAVNGLTESLMQEVRPHNIRVSTITPSLVETDLTRGEDGERNPDKFTQAEDLAEYMVSLLKLEQRSFIKTSAIWATNPF
ncbi:3-ketoacyl-ACP reductase [Jeotgalibacillus terrae]|uniref:3-ketoacyl-ACP reductase n=1 Tax=Jeotgalibacillus terrae TaxID=587735 RepID=A0ABW5ZLV9_9BACL|nr:3-ketoacyl-ACP reductase [Jeotgalibacillus terrae]MBM7580438.1 3-oxoacyl-[acyl-carrier protein] reductase [Jeotgalibacillus terrae]